MITAFGFRPAPAIVGAVGNAALRGRSAFVRLLPPRTESMLTKTTANKTYPGYPAGYTVSELGAGPPPADLDPSWLAKRPARG